MGYTAGSFSTGEQPTTSKWNQLWANDASFHDGTGIDTNAIQAASLATNAISLGFASITSNFTSTATGAYTDVTSLTVSPTIPAGGRRVEISVCAQYMSTTAAAGTNVELVVTDVTAGAVIGGILVNNFGAFYAMNPTFITSHVPSSGSRTYKVQFKSNAAGTFTLACSATTPAFISAKAI